MRVFRYATLSTLEAYEDALMYPGRNVVTLSASANGMAVFAPALLSRLPFPISIKFNRCLLFSLALRHLF